MAGISTHVLDTMHGRPAAGMALRFYRAEDTAPLKALTTNADGRTDGPLMDGAALEPGRYRIAFEVGAYFAALGAALPDPPFLDVVEIRFGVGAADQKYHVPLLVSPWSYSTYRGS